MIKRPRQRNEAHLRFIRSLPCVVCGDNTAIEAAHVRMPAPYLGKRQTGKGEKPDDIWTLPLCSKCHRDQHKHGELLFWGRSRIAALPVALALWAATGDYELGELIVQANRFLEFNETRRRVIIAGRRWRS